MLILATKIARRQIRSQLVARPRLLVLLDQVTERPLTLLSAPAGFGKTTLLVAWASCNTVPVAWLSLDGGDNDPERFLAHVIASVTRQDPNVGTAALGMLQSSPHPPEDAILGAFINDLASSTEQLLLVLEDYQVITAPAIHDMLAFLLDRMPPHVHLVIATRVDPVLPLARLRARNQLLDIRAGDLRFTPDEAADFLIRVMGLRMTPEDIATLDARAEGWIAGLQMAALSMQGRQDIAGFVKAFSGSNRFILDYLIEEVLNQQPPEAQTFLLQTSILDHMTGALCDAITGESNGQAMLERLERANLFLTPLDDQRAWYRYHQLFADLLRQRLQQAQPERVRSLHQLAAAWLAAHARPSAAIDHALAAEDTDLTARIVEDNALDMWAQSEQGFIAGINNLPHAVILAHPRLCVYKAWTHVLRGQQDAAGALLDAADEGFRRQPDDVTNAVAGFAALVRVFLADVAGDRSHTITLVRQALASLPANQAAMLNTVSYMLALACYREGELTEALDACRQVIERDEAGETTNGAGLAAASTARILSVQGHLHLAAGALQRSLRMTAERGRERYYLSGNLNLALAEILREWNDLPAAAAQVDEGIRYNAMWQTPDAAVTGQLVLARILYAQGSTAAALLALNRTEQATRGARLHPSVQADLESSRVRLWLGQGDLAAARRWADESGLATADLRFRCETGHISLARLLLAENRSDEALALLSRLAQAAEAGGRHGRLIEILALMATVLPLRQALATLEQALTLARPEGYVRTFVDQGESMGRLLSTGLEQGAWTGALAAYVHSLRSALPAGAAPKAQTLAEPLSEREIEVLRLVAQGLSNRAIAGQLIISEGTVKAHVHNIYGKLSVLNRVEAIERARTLGIL